MTSLPPKLPLYRWTYRQDRDGWTVFERVAEGMPEAAFGPFLDEAARDAFVEERRAGWAAAERREIG